MIDTEHSCTIGDVTVNYAAHGTGVPLLALHGSGVDHREVDAALAAVVAPGPHRRICPDLPGMGRTTTGGLSGNADVVDLLGEFVGHVAQEPALVLGHSYGAYLARGLAARRPELVLGLALICPIGEGSGAVPDHVVVRQDADAYDELDESLRAGFDNYFAVRTRDTARRYRDHVAPGTSLVDEAALRRLFADWSVDVGSWPFERPTLIVAGRNDPVAGYAGAAALAEQYPHATLAIVDGAGHALMHERPDLFGSLVRDWLERASRSPA